MDDERIRQLTAEVLSQVHGGSGAGERGDLEQRVAALERTVRALEAGTASAPPPTTVHVHTHPHTHPSLQLLGPSAGSDRCIMEPDKPCVQSGMCRTLGH
jgi:hypothetical protein